MNYLPDLLFAAAGIALCYLLWELYRWARPRRPETGATIGWSPRQEEADATADQLTPTGQLERQPAATLDDGTVIGRSGLPAWEALATDTHHALDPAWEAMLTEFRANMDAIIAKLGEPATVGAA